jgi:hypothetical protein
LFTKDLNDDYLRTDDEYGGHHVQAQTRVGGDESNWCPGWGAPGAGLQADDPESSSGGVMAARVPESKTRSFFFGSRRVSSPASPLVTESPRRKNVDEEKDPDPFHKSEADVYALYLAVDGEVGDDGFLNGNRLKEFSPDEAEGLNVTKLIEVWNHTKTGCSRCAMIVSTLNMVRESLAEGAEGSSDESAQADDMKSPT